MRTVDGGESGVLSNRAANRERRGVVVRFEVLLDLLDELLARLASITREEARGEE